MGDDALGKGSLLEGGMANTIDRAQIIKALWATNKSMQVVEEEDVHQLLGNLLVAVIILVAGIG